MTNGSSSICWDSCNFIAWLKGEDTHGANTLSDISEVIEKVESGALILVVSTMVEVEVYQGKIDAGQKRKFSNFLAHRYIERVAVDIPIAQKASEIRAACQIEFGKPASGPDAIHLATALSRNVLEFQTLEGQRNRTHSIGLKKLDGHPIVNRMPVRRPRLPGAGESDMFFGGGIA